MILRFLIMHQIGTKWTCENVCCLGLWFGPYKFVLNLNFDHGVDHYKALRHQIHLLAFEQSKSVGLIAHSTA